MGKFKYAACLWAIGGTADRFCPGGYLDKTASLKERIEIAGSVEGIEGIEIFDSDLEGVNIKEYKNWLSENHLKTSGVIVNTFGIRKFKLGSITHTDKKIREEAKDRCKKNIDLVSELGGAKAGIWLGSDGYDYSFQVDYSRQWDLLVESIKELANYNKKIDITVEYKLKEPRNYLAVPSVLKALYISEECGKNVGVTIDFGHCLMGKEKPAESVSILGSRKKLFNVHMNDAYREWDDDLIAVSVNLHETLEFLYYLEVIGYNGFIGFDIFPFRMDGRVATELCVKNMKGVERILDRIDRNKLREAMESLDSGKSQAIISDAIFSA